jgi:hypothetical protein
MSPNSLSNSFSSFQATRKFNKITTGVKTKENNDERRKEIPMWATNPPKYCGCLINE